MTKFLTNALPGTREIERYEPFETQREFVLAINVNVGGLVTTPQTLDFTILTVQMGVLGRGQTTPAPTAPLAGTGFGGNRQSENRMEVFFKVVEVGKHVSVQVKPGDTRVELKDGRTTAIVPNNKEAAARRPRQPRKLVPPGFKVADRHVVLSVELKVDRNPNVNVTMTKPKLNMAVRNDETYEEYLRVTKDVETILGGSGAPGFGIKFSGFGNEFLKDLKARGHNSTLLKQHGEQLWKDAYEKVQGVAGVKDDRPLYWARLQGIGALRAYSKRKTRPLTPQDLELTINQFEWTSRGLDANGRIIVDDAPPGTRKVVVTGFDPFALPSDINTSNPSGLIALEFYKQPVGSTQPPVHIRTAIFPVRYKEFDAGSVEKAFEVTLDSLFMLVTTSENGARDFYDVERWAGKNRVDDIDNNNMPATGTPVSVGNPPRVSDLLDPKGATYLGDQFLQSTLPYAQVITTTQTLIGPQSNQAPLVINQSYRVIDTTATAFRFGEFRPRPDAGDPDGFTKRFDSPDSSKKADLGSGDNYLSNEIFYRTALVRNVKRPSLASGHFHVPGTDNMPQTTGLKLVEGVRVALGKFVDALSSLQLQPQITSFNPPSGRVGETVEIFGLRLDGASGVRFGGSVARQFDVIDRIITVEVPPLAKTGKIEVDTPYGTGASAATFVVRRIVRPPREEMGPQLQARRQELGIQPQDAARQLGVTSRTYTRWERGQDEPGTRYYPAIDRFLGLEPGPEPETLAERIRAARERDNLSRPQLAQRLGVSASTVQTWEAGTVSRPTPRVTRIFEDYVKEV